MVTLEEYFEELVSQSESDDLEFKSAKGGLPGSLWETYSAFANTDGGTIVLGVAEQEGVVVAEGFDDETIEKYKKDFWNKVNNRDVISVNLLQNDDVKVCEYQGKKFLTIVVPRATREQKPVFCKRTANGNTYKRNNEGDYKCSTEDIGCMYADAAHSLAEDSRILDGFDWNDIDTSTLRQYRNQMASVDPDHPWLNDDDKTLLTHLGGYRKDRKSKKEGLTLAGLLMFGKTESIQDPDCCPYYMVDFRDVPDDDSNIRWTDRVYPDGKWEANLFQFYNRVIPKLQQAIPQKFELDGDTRIDDSTTNKALREACVNCIVHSCYTTKSAITIVKKRSSITLSNPGTLLVSKKQYYEGGESVCRNPSLQKMFQLIGKAEKAGSGSDKIQKGWKDANWRRPYILEKTQPDKVELVMPLESLMNDETEQELNNRFCQSILSNLTHYELTALALTLEMEWITNESLRPMVDLHKFDISQLLKGLCKKGLLVPSGVGRGTKYHLAESVGDNKATEIQRPNKKVASSNKKVASSDKKVASSNQLNLAFVTQGDGGSENSASSGKNDASSDKNDASSGKNDASSDKNDASPQRRKLKKELLYKEITTYCGTFKSAAEIAKQVGKEYSHIRNRVIPKMIEEGLLIMQYPDNRTHPNQKYRKK